MKDAILGIDVGDVKVGIALARAGTHIAVPLGSFQRRASEAENRILELIRREDVRVVVAGLPRDESDQEGAQCKKIRNFCRRLQSRAQIEIVFQDEYGSSDEAASRLGHMKGGRKSAKLKGALDAVAASIILQKYLDEQKHSE